ncbi:hypothetical protein H6F51_10490 [Cyanobacteria bacterium FACHB-DQ100]|nr:hypothetical protein [Cyanobacteria bacterium FACHB-DQ100]
MKTGQHLFYGVVLTTLGAVLFVPSIAFSLPVYLSGAAIGLLTRFCFTSTGEQ